MSPAGRDSGKIGWNCVQRQRFAEKGCEYMAAEHEQIVFTLFIERHAEPCVMFVHTFLADSGNIPVDHLHRARAVIVPCYSDAVGLRAAEGKAHVHDIHATILHLLGFNHKRLTFRHNGRNERLTDNDGEVIEAALV